MMLAVPLAASGFAATAFAVFTLGLRHGADPDHLAAIDNLTRGAAGVGNRLSRFVGTLFAGGHSVMVLSIAALAGLLGSHITLHGAFLEVAGTWVSIVTLFAIAAVNLRQLARNRSGPIAGIKSSLLPKALRAATSPVAAVPIGLLFGLGFDTSSQVATYALAFSQGGGVLIAVLIGLVFSLGMAVTDTLDSLLVYRLCTRAPLELVRATRVWIVAVTSLALAVGGYELAQVLGWQSPVPDIAVSAILVASLLGVFAWTYVSAQHGGGSSLTSGDRSHNGASHNGGNAMTTATRFAGGVAAIAALAGAMFLYTAHPVRGSDHQDSPATVANPAEDITDVFVYQAPDNSSNVVLQMDVWPLITHGQLPTTALDPAVMYQFKIDNSGSGVEDLVLQVQPKGAGTTQQVNIFGPATPKETGTNSQFVAETGSVTFGDRSGTAQANGVKVFVGPTKDPFFFDLLQFFANIPDRYYGCQPGYTNGFAVNCTPPASLPGFRGFTTAFNTLHSSSCLTTAPVDALSANEFNVLAIVAEVPKALLQGASGSVIHVWATTSTVSGH